ncbi:MAG TPA: methyl-accepting chemotaxis protein, partial [Dissulfurispiraceae bacterium]
MGLALRDWKVKYKLLIFVIIALIGIAAVASLSLLSLKRNLLAEKEYTTKHLVETAYGMLDYYYNLSKEGKMTEEEAKSAAIGAVKRLRYEEKEYFWINTDQHPPVMIMHPTVPALDGKVLTDPKFNCATSMKAGLNGETKETDGRKNLFEAFVEVCREKGDGFVHYRWPKPLVKDGKPVLDENGKAKVSEELYEKLSYVKKFAPWGWIIGTGIYLDDVDDIFRNKALVLFAVVAVIMGGLIAVSWLVARSLVKPIEDIAGNINRIASGDLRTSIEYAGEDEIGMLAKDVNKMVQSINSMIRGMLASGGKVVSSVDSLRSMSEKTSEGAKEQSGQAAQIATAAEEMSQTITDIAK